MEGCWRPWCRGWEGVVSRVVSSLSYQSIDVAPASRVALGGQCGRRNQGGLSGREWKGGGGLPSWNTNAEQSRFGGFVCGGGL